MNTIRHYLVSFCRLTGVAALRVDTDHVIIARVILLALVHINAGDQKKLNFELLDLMNKLEIIGK